MVAQRRKRKAPAAVLGDADVREGTVVTVDTAKCKGLHSKPDGPWPVENARHVDDEFLASILETPQGGPLPAVKVWSDAARADASKKQKKALARPEVKAAQVEDALF
jgi:hypothetical protein